MSSQVTLQLLLSGKVGSFTLEPSTFTYTLSGQTLAEGPKDVLVPAAAAPGSVSVCLEPMAEQNLLLIVSDKKITYRLNGDGIDREVNETGFAIHPGDPVVTELDFGGNGTQDAHVTVIRLGLSGATPGGGLRGGAYEYEGPFTAVALQTDFPLAFTPAKPTRLLLFKDGIMHAEAGPNVSVVVAGAGAPKVVWTGAALAGGERIEVIY